MYTEPKYVDPLGSCYFYDGAPSIMCYKCAVLRCTFHASTLCQSEVCVGLVKRKGPKTTPTLLLLMMMQPITPIPLCAFVASGIRWACRVFTSGGGGGGIEPPKTGGLGKRAQLTNGILTKEKVGIHGGNFDFE